MAEGLSNSMTVVALVNGMIGGIILVMPILSLKSGYLMIAPVVVLSGFFSYYSCLLCVRHLRNYKDLDEAVFRHFHNKKSYKIFYDLCIAVSLVVLLVLYFDLVCKQWEGITGGSRLVPLLNALVLFPIVYVMKKYKFGAVLLAYGIVSTIGFCFFILYMWIVSPQGDSTLVPVNKHFPQLAAALSQGFSIQAFFIPVLKQNPNKQSHRNLLLLTYLLGGLIYAFLGYGGALSIVNLPYPGPEKPETITQYFRPGEWEVVLVQIIYLVHLYSAFPEFLIISKKRLFSVLEWPQSNDVSFKEVVYTGLVILVCLVIKLTKISAETLIELNGSVISFVFIVVIPVGLHVKCVYFTAPGHRHHRWEDEIDAAKNMQSAKTVKQTNIQSEPEAQQQLPDPNKPAQTQLKAYPPSSQFLAQSQSSPGASAAVLAEDCSCDISFKSRLHQWGEIVVMAAMVLTGLATMGYTIYLIISDDLGDSPSL